MNENKTRETDDDVDAFIEAVEDETRRDDSRKLIRIMQDITGKPPKLWGPSIVGFGKYHYRYDSGREGDFMMVGFSPRKRNLVLYIMPGFSGYEAYLKKLGKHKTGKSCLYLKYLSDVDVDVLRKLVADSFAEMRRRYECE